MNPSPQKASPPKASPPLDPQVKLAKMMQRAALLATLVVVVIAPLAGCLVVGPLLQLIGLKPYIVAAGVGVLVCEPVMIAALWIWASKAKG